MYAHFTFKDHSNPYIATTNESLYFMFRTYDVEFDPNPNQTIDNFIVHGTIPEAKRARTYREARNLVRSIAIEWQSNFCNHNYSWGELADWSSFFTQYGKRYGLLREFRENGIC